MKLLQTMAGSEMGGAEAFFVRLAIALNKAGIDQKIVIRRDAARARALRRGGVIPVELPFGGRMDFRTRPALQREIRRFGPDVVLSWMSRATWATPTREEGLDYRLVGRLGGYYDLKYYRHCDHLIGNTADIVDYIIDEGWDPARVHYLPNFVHEPEGEPQSRFGFDTPIDAPLLLVMGRLHENKAIDVAIRALANLPDMWLWVAGEGPQGSSLNALASECGVADRVRFLGWRDDTGALLQACDVFVCPSRHEPLGNVVLEAWAARKPVVATEAAGPTALMDDGVTGVLVPIDDPAALAAAISAIVAAPERAAAIAAAGRERYEAEFTEAAVVSRYIDFFSRVAP